MYAHLARVSKLANNTIDAISANKPSVAVDAYAKMLKKQNHTHTTHPRIEQSQLRAIWSAIWPDGQMVR